MDTEKVKVRYRRATFTVRIRGGRPKKCEICGREGKIDLHHFRYKYKTSEVRKDKQKALENTIWLCFSCHRLGDAVRMVDENREKAEKIMEATKVYKAKY